MTASDIFKMIIDHEIKGVMFHEEMSNYFDFLSLRGFKRLHEYHFLDEVVGLRGVQRYYINHYNTLLPNTPVESPRVIPSNWSGYSRYQVDTGTRANAVKTGFEKWQTWEQDTKKLYEKAYKNLCDIGEIAAAIKVKDLIEDVDMELKCADRMCLELKGVNYDMAYIFDIQDELHDKYEEKTKSLGVDIC